MGRKKLNENDPLTPIEETAALAFVAGKPITSVLDDLGFKYKNPISRKSQSHRLLNRPNVQRRIKELMEEMKKASIMTGEEVMEYFTAVTRGEIKDQFGLDAPLSERTAAAKEIAKRTIDIDLKKQDTSDNSININLNWERISD